MDDLLKEAIADAKAVRETALENAKMALEEAFTPRLQNMLSQKIQTEMEDEDEKDVDEISYKEDDEDPSDDDVDEISYKEDDEDPSDDVDEDPSDVDETKIIEIDGVKYAPVVSEEEDEDEMDEIAKDDDEDMEEDLDLESVIKELESELEEGEDKDEKEEMDENDVSSDIGNGDNKVNKKANDSSGVGSDGKAKLKEGEDKDEDEMDEDIDLDEVLKALSEEEDEDEKKDEVSELKSDLEEHRSVIETLRGKLNEVNLLNAKLLFTNKLFRKHGLNNEQKMKVVEQFDRASNLREVKLVYSTLGESFGARKNEINEHKGSASKPIASTKSEKKVITESSDLRDRFKKLANLI
jgi:hypothetical protein